MIVEVLTAWSGMIFILVMAGLVQLLALVEVVNASPFAAFVTLFAPDKPQLRTRYPCHT